MLFAKLYQQFLCALIHSPVGILGCLEQFFNEPIAPLNRLIHFLTVCLVVQNSLATNEIFSVSLYRFTIANLNRIGSRVSFKKS